MGTTNHPLTNVEETVAAKSDWIVQLWMIRNDYSLLIMNIQTIPQNNDAARSKLS